MRLELIWLVSTTWESVTELADWLEILFCALEAATHYGSQQTNPEVIFCFPYW